jgi:release factor glutamine methyltransferase
MTFEVEVGPGVFVPRPETEALAQWALSHLSSLAPGENGIHAVDLCSGSGVLAITLARAVPYAEVTAVEISDEAMPYLRRNVSKLAPQVVVVKASVAEAGSTLVDHGIDLLVANPPYVPLGEVPNDPEVFHWDPKTALFGGDDGLDVIRECVALGSRVLRPGAGIALEHSNLQGDLVRAILSDSGFRTVATERDLTGRDRFSFGFQP